MNYKELKRLKELEEKNRKLKQMYANLTLDHLMAKEVFKKNLWSPSCNITKELIHYGINRACRVLNMSKNVFYYKTLPKENTEIEIF